MRMTSILSALAVAGVLGFAGSAWAQPAGSTSARYNACYQDAVGKGLSGEARRTSIDQCLSTPMAQNSLPAERSYRDCRSAAIARGLAGDQLNAYLDRCMKS